MKRRFVIIGRKATASAEFSLLDIAGTSGRLDVLLRSLRAALLVSHGVRKDAIVYLVLLGGPRAPRVVRVDGESAKFLRPDERALATLVQKTLAHEGDAHEFVEVRPGVSVAAGGIDAVLADMNGATPLVLEEGGRDVRALDDEELGAEVAVFVGGPDGFDPDVRARLDALGAKAISIGPVSVHADDAIAIVSNELDRRGVAR